MNRIMDRVIDGIIRHSHSIEKLFMILVVLSVICMPFVGVNYDLTEYLPDFAPSQQGLNVMEDTFGYPGTARIMIKDVSIYQAKYYKDRIASLDGVDMIMWADSSADIYQSQSFLQTTDLDDYYKDRCAVMDVTFVEGDTSKVTHKAIDRIQEILGEKGYLCGAAVQNKSLEETLLREISIAMAMGVVMIALVLCVTTTSWFEPVLFLMIMGIAIVINMGTNIFLGTISFLTFSMASILQLAIAMDYSIFLLHTFTREKNSGLDTEAAMANAIRLSVSSILSSGATTIVGFIVLTLMKFSIGRDLGIVLAKGIVISLLTVLLLMPALILRWSGKVERTAHKPFVPPLDKLARAIFKIRWPFFLLILVIVVPCYVAQNMNAFRYGNDALGGSPGTKVYNDEQEINKLFGRSNLILVLVPQQENNVTEKALTDALEDLNYVKSVTSLAGSLPEGIPESFLPDSLTEQLHKNGYSRMLVPIRTSAESALAYRCVDEITEIVGQYYPEEAYVVGVTPSTMDIQEIITEDYRHVNILSLLGVALVILLTFKSAMIPIVVMVPIEVAIFINMALPYILGDELVFMGYLIVSCLQLGATVDYSILLTNNYLDLRTEIADKKQAAVAAISKSALSVLTSGAILTIVGYGLFFTSSVSAIANMGRLVGRGALFSMVLVLCLLPMLLTMFDRVINNQLKRIARLNKRLEIRKQRHAQSLLRRRAAIDQALKDIAKMNGGLVFYHGGFRKLRERRLRLKQQKNSRLILTDATGESPEAPETGAPKTEAAPQPEQTASPERQAQNPQTAGNAEAAPQPEQTAGPERQTLNPETAGNQDSSNREEKDHAMQK